MLLPLRSILQDDNLLCRPLWGYRTRTAPHQSTEFYDPGTTWLANTDSDSKPKNKLIKQINKITEEA